MMTNMKKKRTVSFSTIATKYIHRRKENEKT